jgi:methylenetetrahydrofolate dehydrogenase (NADP+)/methenyltetrahydrofolate cyclohydrolase
MATTTTFTKLDGKNLAKTIRKELANKVEQLKKQGQTPHLAAVLVGSDPASETYVNFTVKDCKSIGVQSSLIRLEEDVSEEKLLQKVDELNKDDDIDGFIVQLPLPDHIDDDTITRAITPEKDVDGFHPANVGRLVKGWPAYISATPLGILKLLSHYEITTEGKHAVIVGRSQIVGTPLSILLSRKSEPGNCTTTLCHSRTKNLKAHTQQADILVSALGQPAFIGKDMVKEGAIVIDVGISRVEDESKKKGYRLQGDVNFEEVAPKCSYITPVPGGVGPMTRTGLLLNTMKAAEGSIYG